MNVKAIRWKVVVEKNIGPVEVHLGESTFTMAGLEGHHLKHLIQFSIGAARPNMSCNIMQIEMNNITFETSCQNIFS